MSKLYDTYLSLKKENSEKIYMFKSGIFYIFLDKDAELISSIFNFKLTKLNDKVIKCGFPINSYRKYTTIFEQLPYEFKIIDTSNNTSMSLSDFKLNNNFSIIYEKLKMVDTNQLSVSEAYNFINELKTDLNL